MPGFLTGEQMDSQERIQEIGKRLISLFLVSFVLLCISVLTTAMITTATFTPSEAGGILKNLGPDNVSNTLWALIIPAAFFVVLFSRNNKSPPPRSDG
jgi:hypothetical protein